MFDDSNKNEKTIKLMGVSPLPAEKISKVQINLKNLTFSINYFNNFIRNMILKVKKIIWIKTILILFWSKARIQMDG